MKTFTTTRRNGTVRWISSQALPFGTGRLAITSETKAGSVTNEYDVRVSRMDVDGRVVAVDLVSSNGKTYHTDLTDSFCSCPDHCFRKSECKHSKAARAAFARLQLS
jgi:hypothetical protein